MSDYQSVLETSEPDMPDTKESNTNSFIADNPGMYIYVAWYILSI